LKDEYKIVLSTELALEKILDLSDDRQRNKMNEWMTPFSLYVWVFKFGLNMGRYLSSGASNIHFLHEALKGVEDFFLPQNKFS